MSVRQFDAIFDLHDELRGYLTSDPDSQARADLLPGPYRQATDELVSAVSYALGAEVLCRGTKSDGVVGVHQD